MKGGRRIQVFIKSQKGSTSVIIVCVTMIIILASALLADIGYASVVHFKLKRNAESVAKEGAKLLVDSKERALSYMKSSSVKKEYDLNALDIRISNNNREVTVSMGKPFRYIFLSFLGYGSKQIKTSVTVKLSCVGSYKYTRPFAVEKHNIVFGKSIILSDRPELRLDTARFHVIDTGTGSLKTNIIYGNGKSFKAGEKVKLLKNYSISRMEEGLQSIVGKCSHQPSCTFDRYVNGCSRILVLPVIGGESDKSGNLFTISGFTAFFIEDYDIIGGFADIKGKFIKYTVKSNAYDGAEDYGLLGVRIVN